MELTNSPHVFVSPTRVFDFRSRAVSGILRLPNGQPYAALDERRELRKILWPSIDHEMKRIGANCLDVSLIVDFIGPFRHCTKCELASISGIRFCYLPPLPCGGVVDNHGRTDAQLYAIGEVSYLGLHGANRLASNSLLGYLVYGRAAKRSLAHWISIKLLSKWDESEVTDSDESVIIAHNWDDDDLCGTTGRCAHGQTPDALTDRSSY